ncbi:hypothetical protein OH687_30795 [Burkholderia anthina]|nr:hypothetical protein OH687_30795 [Burkholderia anthina]
MLSNREIFIELQTFAFIFGQPKSSFMFSIFPKFMRRCFLLFL